MYILAKSAEGFGYFLSRLAITMIPMVYLFEIYWRRRPGAIQLKSLR